MKRYPVRTQWGRGDQIGNATFPPECKHSSPPCGKCKKTWSQFDPLRGSLRHTLKPDPTTKIVEAARAITAEEWDWIVHAYDHDTLEHGEHMAVDGVLYKLCALARAVRGE